MILPLPPIRQACLPNPGLEQYHPTLRLGGQPSKQFLREARSIDVIRRPSVTPEVISPVQPYGTDGRLGGKKEKVVSEYWSRLDSDPFHSCNKSSGWRVWEEGL